MTNIFISKLTPAGDVLECYLVPAYYRNSYYFIEDEPPTKDSVFIMPDIHLLDDNQYYNLQTVNAAGGIIFITQLTGHCLTLSALTTKILYLVNELSIDSRNIWIQFKYDSDKTHLTKMLNMLGIFLGNTYVYDHWMNLVYDDYIESKCKMDTVEITSKFSAFSRRFSDERFYLYCELLSNKILGDFVYTFANCHAEAIPYPYTMITIDEMISLASTNGHEDPDIVSWIENMPYANLDDFTNPFSTLIYYQMAQAALNLVIETELGSGPPRWRGITEKTYKPIIMRKPFLVFGSSEVMKQLQSEGFKTFHPYIDEHYVHIEDSYPIVKVWMIVAELDRLLKLPENEFNHLMTELQDITEYNFQRFLQLAEDRRQSVNDIIRDLCI